MNDTQTFPTVLIVGGTSGLGEALAIMHAKLGWTVHVVGRSYKKHLDWHCHEYDVGDEDFTSQVTGLLTNLGRIDRLIWAAGYYQPGALEDIEALEIACSMRVNCISLQVLVAAVMRKYKVLPSLCVVTSTSARRARPNEPVYAAAKAAAAMYARSVSECPSVRQVVEVAPAMMRTAFWREVPAKDLSLALDPMWVAEQTMKLLHTKQKYIAAHVLYGPDRVEIIKET